MIFEMITDTPEATEAAGKMLAEAIERSGLERLFIALRGEMGVGKTAFTRGFATQFGIYTVKSPTYTVVNEYRGKKKIHHFDLYRISDGDDLYSIGFDDIIENDGYSIAEWSENVEDFLPDERITVSISRLGSDAPAENIRKITFDIPYIKEVSGKIENISL